MTTNVETPRRRGRPPGGRLVTKPDDFDQLHLRLPRAMTDWLRRRAEAEGRSVTSEALQIFKRAMRAE